MAQHSWSDLWDRQAESIEYNRKLMETYMKITEIDDDYDREFDMMRLVRRARKHLPGMRRSL